MSYSIELSANFKKEAKKLSKKYPSLKTELTKLFAELEKTQRLVCLLATIFTKYDWLLLPKTKENQEEQGFYHS